MEEELPEIVYLWDVDIDEALPYEKRWMIFAQRVKSEGGMSEHGVYLYNFLGSMRKWIYIFFKYFVKKKN